MYVVSIGVAADYAVMSIDVRELWMISNSANRFYCVSNVLLS